MPHNLLRSITARYLAPQRCLSPMRMTFPSSYLVGFTSSPIPQALSSYPSTLQAPQHHHYPFPNPRRRTSFHSGALSHSPSPLLRRRSTPKPQNLSPTRPNILTSLVSATDPVDPILPSLPEDEDENFTQEHQIFIAYLKHRVSEEEIADRFLEAFPDLVAGCGANAHGKLVAKWMAVERYVGMMMSRWAPVQSVGEYSFVIIYV